MTTAKADDEVVVTFTVTTQEGQVVGSTEKDGPVTAKLGSGTIYPEVEAGIVGMSAGDEKTVLVPAASAFGPRREDLVVKIPKANLPPGQEPQPGMMLQAQSPDGKAIALTIVSVEDDGVMADGNHPLAGHDLNFNLTLVEIKTAA